MNLVKKTTTDGGHLYWDWRFSLLLPMSPTESFGLRRPNPINHLWKSEASCYLARYFLWIWDFAVGKCLDHGLVGGYTDGCESEEGWIRTRQLFNGSGFGAIWVCCAILSLRSRLESSITRAHVSSPMRLPLLGSLRFELLFSLV